MSRAPLSIIPASLFLLTLPGCDNYATTCDAASVVVEQGREALVDLSCSFLTPSTVSGLLNPFAAEYETTVSVRNEAALRDRGVRITRRDSRIVLEAEASAQIGSLTSEFWLIVNGYEGEAAELTVKVVPPASSDDAVLEVVDALGAAVTIGSSDRTCRFQTCSFVGGLGEQVSLSMPADAVTGARCLWSCSHATYRSCAASFAIIQDTVCQLTLEHLSRKALLVSVEGPGEVAVHVNGAPASCSGTTCLIETGASVELSAVSEPGSSFVGWSGDCTGSPEITQFSMTADMNCTAEFKAKPKLQVEMQRDSSQFAHVVAEGAAISCPGDCSDEVAPNSAVTLRVVRKAEINDQLEITWGGACQGSANETQVTVDSDKMCTVTVRPIDVCAGAQAPATLALDVYVNSSPLVVDRSSGIAVVQVSRYSELSLDTSSTQVSSGVAATYTWEIGGQQWAIGPTTTWTASDPGTNSVTGVLRYSDNCGNTQTLDMRFDIGF